MRKKIFLPVILFISLCLSLSGESAFHLQAGAGYAVNLTGAYSLPTTAVYSGIGLQCLDLSEFYLRLLFEKTGYSEWNFFTFEAEVRLSPGLGIYHPYLGIGVTFYSFFQDDYQVVYFALGLLRFSLKPLLLLFLPAPVVPDNILLAACEVCYGPFYPVIIRENDPGRLPGISRGDYSRLSVKLLSLEVRL